MTALARPGYSARASSSPGVLAGAPVDADDELVDAALHDSAHKAARHPCLLGGAAVGQDYRPWTGGCAAASRLPRPCSVLSARAAASLLRLEYAAATRRPRYVLSARAAASPPSRAGFGASPRRSWMRPRKCTGMRPAGHAGHPDSTALQNLRVFLHLRAAPMSAAPSILLSMRSTIRSISPSPSSSSHCLGQLSAHASFSIEVLRGMSCLR